MSSVLHLEGLHGVRGEEEIDHHGPLGGHQALQLVLRTVVGVHIGLDHCTNVRSGLARLAPK